MSDENWQVNRLAHATGSLMSALGEALKEICRMKGPEALAWLDEFEAKAQLRAKKSVAEGLSYEEEARSVEASLSILSMIIAETRKKCPPV